jgi:hypothetical protein
MLRAHALGIAEMYWGHAGPNEVESYTASSSSSLSGGVHRLVPTGGCACQKMTTISLERHYLCIWYPLELSDVWIRIIQVANERSSSNFDGQIIGGIV